ncbi:hypothetical protein QC763_0097070 [Podospora pseudopauciseta]|uniref:Uncharacterized protein n=1 Tax=Podospora pseudopauciseta TaxID=2093780 RepID=A0ABR0H5X4_9PEZI|nr:hypothetical protein QC763_0097070 [Podospora pseudopauciseta]
MFEVVDVNATFIGGDLALDLNNPPRVVEGSATESTMRSETNSSSAEDCLYAHLPVLPVAKGLRLDPLFRYLTSSFRVIPVGHLGDPDNIGEVAEAIKYQYGIIQAQYLAVQLVPAGETNVTLSGGVDGDAVGWEWRGMGEGAGEGYQVLVGVGGCG